MLIDQQPAAGHIEEAWDQVHQRAFAGAAGTHDGQHLARFHLQIDIAQNLPRLFAVFPIGKADPVEADALGKTWQRLGAWLLTNLVLNIHEAKDFRGCPKRLLEVVVEEGELSDRVVEFEYGNDKRQENARRECVMRN